MATPRTVTLGVFQKKEDAVLGAGSTADGDVIVEFDKDANQLDVVNALKRVIQVIIEEEYN